jgi:PAS domain S-box-containing protein
VLGYPPRILALGDDVSDGGERRQRERGVRQGSSRGADSLHLLVDSVIDYGIFTLDVDGHVESWNVGAERLKGWTADEIIGRHFSTFYPEEDVQANKPDDELAMAVATGRFEDEGWRIRKDGSRFWANVVITALRGEDGRLQGFGKVTRDLTDRRRGEEALRLSEERFRLLVGSVADYAIFMLDVDGHIMSWNLGAERLKGYRADEIVGQHFALFYGAEDQRAGRPAKQLATALAEGRAEDEGWRIRKDGTRFWANVVITALRSSDGRLVGFGKVTRDLTQRKRSEDALRGVLERERDATARMRELDDARRELVAIVAHDVRAPINVLGGLVELLRDDWSTMTEPDRDDLLRRIGARARSVGALVDDVLDVVRLESGEFAVDLHPTDVVAVARRAIDDLGDEAVRVDLRVDDGAPTHAWADEQRVWQVVMNLLTNALRFSDDDQPVSVAVRRRGDDQLLVTVGDHGAGVPEAQRATIFDRFSRIPGADGRRTGSGLGLYICRRVVEALGGSIWVEGAPGGGAAFSFTLPIVEDDPGGRG